MPDFINSMRGQLILAKALAYAVRTIDALPKNQQESSDRDDMVYLLNTYFAQWQEIAAQSVEFHTGTAPNLIDHKMISQKAE